VHLVGFHYKNVTVVLIMDSTVETNICAFLSISHVIVSIMQTLAVIFCKQNWFDGIRDDDLHVAGFG